MEKTLAKQLIKYFKSLGIEVYTNTKARGHQGFFLKNRIDISKNTKEDRIVPTLLHEFAHYIHSKLEPDMAKTGGTIEELFCLKEEKTPSPQPSPPRGEGASPNLSPFHPLTLSPTLENELLLVTNFVDPHSLSPRLQTHKEQVKKKIKSLESIIKQYYPKFMRSKKFKEFDKYIKKSKAKYLLKYDRVKFVSPFLRRIEIFSIDNLENDFPDMPTAFCAYIRLKSQQKKQARISSRINKLNKYYSKPTELFARLVEGIYLDPNRIQTLAPQTCERFLELMEQGYYCELQTVFQLISGFKTETTNLSSKYLFAQS